MLYLIAQLLVYTTAANQASAHCLQSEHTLQLMTAPLLYYCLLGPLLLATHVSLQNDSSFIASVACTPSLQLCRVVAAVTYKC